MSELVLALMVRRRTDSGQNDLLLSEQVPALTARKQAGSGQNSLMGAEQGLPKTELETVKEQASAVEPA